MDQIYKLLLIMYLTIQFSTTYWALATEIIHFLYNIGYQSLQIETSEFFESPDG